MKPVPAVSVTTGAEVERRGDDRHVGLPAMGDDYEAAGLEREPPRAEHVHAEGRGRVGPHAVADSVVEVRHVSILQGWRRSGSGMRHPASTCRTSTASVTPSPTTTESRSQS